MSVGLHMFDGVGEDHFVDGGDGSDEDDHRVEGLVDALASKAQESLLSSKHLLPFILCGQKSSETRALPRPPDRMGVSANLQKNRD